LQAELPNLRKQPKRRQSSQLNLKAKDTLTETRILGDGKTSVVRVVAVVEEHEADEVVEAVEAEVSLAHRFMQRWY
jgi:hypothetical protein